MKRSVFRLGQIAIIFLFYLFGTFLFGQQSRPLVIEPVPQVAGQRYAFLVGIDEYEQYTSLQYTVNDIMGLRDHLLELGFPESNIILLTSGARRLANRPTKKNIESRFSEFVSELRRGDVAICMLSGHGTEVEGIPYFCPEDAGAESVAQVCESCVSISAMMQQLEGSLAKFKWMIVDACRNDPTKSSPPAEVKSLGSIAKIPEGVALFQSCATGQLSWEDDQFQHGVFSRFLLEGLGGAAADSSGTITLYDICKYTTSKTRDHVLTTRQKEQLPRLKGEMSDFILREGKKPSTPLSQPSPDELLIEGVNRLKWKDAESSYQLAIASRRNKDYVQALREIKKSLSILPTKHEYWDEQLLIEQSLDRENRNLANGYAKLAKDYLDAKDYVKSQLEIEKALKLFPEDYGYELVQTSIKIRTKPPVPSSESPVIPPPSSSPSSTSFDINVGSKAGDRKVLTIKGIEYAFRWCPQGKFMMGSPDYGSGETQHQVTLTKGFWMLETEVTQGMWVSVMEINPSWFSATGSGINVVKGIDTKNFPVEQVTWDDCQEFITKLNELLREADLPINVGGSLPFRDSTQRATNVSRWVFSLPTEAQWEYACRAGTTGPYGGTGILDDMGWYRENSDSKPHPVGLKNPNAWGLYDMHGNVWEWCLDWYGDYPSGALTDPTGPNTSTYRVNRGGGWGNYTGDPRRPPPLPPIFLVNRGYGWNYDTRGGRSADRCRDAPSGRNSFLGFRPCLIPFVP